MKVTNKAQFSALAIEGYDAMSRRQKRKLYNQHLYEQRKTIEQFNNENYLRTLKFTPQLHSKCFVNATRVRVTDNRLTNGGAAYGVKRLVGNLWVSTDRI